MILSHGYTLANLQNVFFIVILTAATSKKYLDRNKDVAIGW